MFTCSLLKGRLTVLKTHCEPRVLDCLDDKCSTKWVLTPFIPCSVQCVFNFSGFAWLIPVIEIVALLLHADDALSARDTTFLIVILFIDWLLVIYLFDGIVRHSWVPTAHRLTKEVSSCTVSVTIFTISFSEKTALFMKSKPTISITETHYNNKKKCRNPCKCVSFSNI